MSARAEFMTTPELLMLTLTYVQSLDALAKAAQTCKTWREYARAAIENWWRAERCGRIWVAGGHRSRGGDVIDMHSFHPAHGLRSEPGLPWADSFTCLVPVRDKLYLLSGSKSLQSTHVRCFDPRTRDWSILSYSNFNLTPRSGAGTAVVNDKIYLIGGCTRSHEATRVSERFDPLTRKWERLADMTHPRHLFGIAVLDGQIFAIGGLNAAGDEMDTVERYDPEGDTWESVAPMTGKRCYSGVAGFVLAASAAGS